MAAERAEEEQLCKKDKDIIITIHLTAAAIIVKETKAIKEKEENKKMIVAFVKAEEKRAAKAVRKVVRAQLVLPQGQIRLGSLNPTCRPG